MTHQQTRYAIVRPTHSTAPSYSAMLPTTMVEPINSLPLLRIERLRLASADLVRTPLWVEAPAGNILNSIDLQIHEGETVGIVGESGSGKTTLGRCTLRLLKPTSGSIHFAGTDITRMSQRQLRPLRRDMQMIFQDPQSSLNPRLKIGQIIARPLQLHGADAQGRNLAADNLAANSRDTIKRRVADALERVGLANEFSHRYPHELSGGQRQRVGIARAIATEPKLIVADEIASGLDVSSQATVLALLEQLKTDLNLAVLFISHDLAVVRGLCERVAVMKNGCIIEQNHSESLFNFPRHPYTRELIAAIPSLDVDPKWLDHSRESHEFGGIAMQVKNSVALVTGANRGIGRCFVEALIARGASKVYAASRHSAGNSSKALTELVAKYADKVIPVTLDITYADQVAAAAQQCHDVSLLINNAGVNNMSAFIAGDNIDAARTEMDVNYFGTLAMCRAFAPVLAKHQGGAMVNMLSILARVNLPLMGSLCASKAAGLSLVQGLRAELDSQGTAVIAVMPGAVDTDMSRDFPPPKMPPADVANAALDGLENGEEEIYPGEMAGGVSTGLASDAKAVEKEFAGILPST